MKRPVRSCAACRKRGAKDEFVRLSNTPAGVVVDYNERLPGRGAYLCFEAGCLEAGLDAKVLSRAFKLNVSPPEREAFYAGLRENVERKIVSILGIARKSGGMRMGFDEAKEAAGKSPKGLVVISQDASENTVRKFMEAVPASGPSVLRFGTKDALGKLLGTAPVAVLCVTGAGLAAALQRETGRMSLLIRG